MSNLVGYYTDYRQEEPVYDPGLEKACIVCIGDLTPDTCCSISLSPLHGSRSLFFRAHKSCWNNLPEQEQLAIESSIIKQESEHDKDRQTQKQASRDKDTETLSNGEKTADELRKENGAFAYAFRNARIIWNKAKRLA